MMRWLLAVLLLAGCCGSQDYGAWLAEHRESCPRCGVEGSTLCDGAFIELQISLRQYDLVPRHDKARAMRLWGIDDQERSEVAREFEYEHESEK